MTTIQEVQPGDYVRTSDGYERIKEIHGVGAEGQLQKGGFHVVTESGRVVDMFDARSYHKAHEMKMPIGRSAVLQISGSMLIDMLINAAGDDTTRGIVAMAMCHYADEHFGMGTEGSRFLTNAINVMGRKPLAAKFVAEYESAWDWIAEDANHWIRALYPNG